MQTKEMIDPRWYKIDNLPFDQMMLADRYWLPQVLSGKKIIAKVEYKGIHAFRRYSITWSHEQGASLPALAIRSGHKSTKTIEKHYLNL